MACLVFRRNHYAPPQSLLLTGLSGAGAQNVLGTVIGALIFPDFRFHPLNVLGLALGMAGAVWYATEAALKVGSSCFGCLQPAWVPQSQP